VNSRRVKSAPRKFIHDVISRYCSRVDAECQARLHLHDMSLKLGNNSTRWYVRNNSKHIRYGVMYTPHLLSVAESRFRSAVEYHLRSGAI